MNRVNKITSVFTIALFVAMLAVPLLNAAECDMECCSVQMPTECGMEMGPDTCCPIMAECSDVVFIPIVTAPILKVNVEKDLTVEYLTTVEIIPSFKEAVSAPSYQLKILTSEVHSGFNTPLLV